MRNIVLGLFAATTLLTGAVRAVEPSTAAQDRAVRYQSEVRAALTKRGWRITKDEAGKLTAERQRPVGSGTDRFVLNDDINKYARLQIDFRAVDGAHTASSARASLLIYNLRSTDGVSEMPFPPSPLRDPKLTQEYREILAEADSHVATDHRAYAAAAGNSGKVAVK